MIKPIQVLLFPFHGYWRIRWHGPESVSSGSLTVCTSLRVALEVSRKMAQYAQADLVIHNANGQVAARWNYSSNMGGLAGD